MKSFKQYITENTTVTLKTPKGSRVGRSTKYGIGKTMGSDTWVHKDYMHKVIPPNILRNALEVLPEDFKYNTVKYNDKTRIVRFESSDNFDLCHRLERCKYPTCAPLYRSLNSGFRLSETPRVSKDMQYLSGKTFCLSRKCRFLPKLT